jgi:hypothetical protein
MKPSNDTAELLANNILSQAAYYLGEADEFYPFGAVIDENNNIKPVSIYWGEEHPKSSDVLLKLEDAIRKGIQKGIYYCGAVGVDVYINIPTNADTIERKTAIQINIHSAERCVVKHFLYTKNEASYIFEPYMLIE